MNGVLEYLSDLSLNNNREWYHANKARHQQANAEFEHIKGRSWRLLLLRVNDKRRPAKD